MSFIHLHFLIFTLLSEILEFLAEIAEERLMVVSLVQCAVHCVVRAALPSPWESLSRRTWLSEALPSSSREPRVRVASPRPAASGLTGVAHDALLFCINEYLLELWC